MMIPITMMIPEIKWQIGLEKAGPFKHLNTSQGKAHVCSFQALFACKLVSAAKVFDKISRDGRVDVPSFRAFCRLQVAELYSTLYTPAE